ncbi:EFR1 family ferrodoxin [Methanoplanus limicola]|uniref:4Fe-4S ferredoxin iron-sulfur binding domain-containing protein n=1 Tax=Methanoplanus limicola DSM 2279 TaxID=937775 RepID=H1Z0M1_9EURY|nr:EFR1 family ferrodoxin [Methanoplanus limicola]EHQ35278.1 4Fe-4S ferredoxin iron-sulfur binding domain-containing protein [Methanoplanus limicola DSM 2279]
MKILILYFSATGNTAGIADFIAEKFTAFGAETETADITPHEARQKETDLTPYDAVVFGFPVHSWRAPREAREWLHTLKGMNKKCSIFFTYGGFGIHPAHHSTKKILEERSFTVVSSAEFLSPHTFNTGGWKAMEERPDQSDYDMAEEYAAATYRRFTGEDEGVLGEMEKTKHSEEFLDEIESFRFRILTKLPTREGSECCMCRICEEACPSGAMNAEGGEPDPERCTACLACVAKCPEDALKINDMSDSWQFKLKNENISEEEMMEKKSRIYL